LGTKDVNAGLAAGFPVIGEVGEGVDSAEADGGTVVAELGNAGTEAFGEQLDFFAAVGRFAELLFPVGDGQGDDASDARNHRQGDLHDVELFAGAETSKVKCTAEAVQEKPSRRE
jgi:hypothetical protein